MPRLLTGSVVAALTALTGTVLALPSPALAARVLTVGPDGEFATPCAAFALAQDGDRVTIDAAGSRDYRGDVCTITANELRITGVNGRPHIRAAGQNAGGKAIWVVAGDGTRITNVEMSGAKVPDRNGAAIRQEGTDLRLTRVWFHHNEMGLLAGDDPESDIRITRSRFSDNGFGDGYSHNLYVNRVKSLTMSYSWSSRSRVGHLVKSRAATTRLLYNRLSSDGGTSSYEVDLPNGGLGILVGNTLVNDSAHPGTAVLLGDDVVGPVHVRNNVVVDFASLTSGAATRTAGNCATSKPGFVDRRRLDYFLRTASVCRDVTTTKPGRAQGRPLTPRAHYAHPAGRGARTDAGAVVGAFGTVPGG